MKHRKHAPAALLLAVCLLFAACAAPEAPQLLEESAYPHVAVSEERIAPPAYPQYEGWSVHITTAGKQSIILYDAAVVGLTLQAWGSPRLEVDDPNAQLNNKLEFFDAEGSLRYTFALSSDGKLLLRDDMNRTFRLPEYVYYTLEGQLAAYGLALKTTPLAWNATGDNAALQLEYFLPYIIKTVKVPSLGYAMAYFTDVKIYQTRTLDDDTVKVYMLVSFVGYDVLGSSFAVAFRDIRPVSMVLSPQKGGSWQVTSYAQAADPKNYESVRTILPYDFAKQALADAKNPDPLLQDIRAQAADYLRETGLGMISVEE